MKIKGSSIPLLTFITGFCSIILQSVIIREFLVVSFGNELSIALVLAGWLTGISVGAFFSSRFITSKTESVLLWILSLMPFLSFPLIALIRISRSLFGIQAGEYFPFASLFLISFTIIPLSSLITGLSFPLLCRIKEDCSSGKRNSLLVVFAVESAGSLFGGAAFTFFLINFFSSFELISIINILFLSGIVFSIDRNNDNYKGRTLLYLSASLSALLIILFSGGQIKKADNLFINLRWQTLAPDTVLLKSVDTKYQNVAIGKRGEQANIYLNGEYSGTMKDDYGFSMTANFILNEHQNPEKILVIGGAVTGLAERILKYPVTVLDYVDLDPELIKLSEEYQSMGSPAVFSDQRLKKYTSDGRYFLSNSEKKYDIIILNLSEPHNAVINRFYTEDFFRLSSLHLKKKGILALSIALESNYIGRESLFYGASIYNSLGKIFKNVLATPGERIYFLAGNSKDAPTADVPVLAKRFLSKKIDDQFFSPFHFRVILPPDRVKFINEKLASVKNVPDNTDFQPVSYFYNLILWDRFSTEKSRGTFAGTAFYLTTVSREWYFLFALVFFILLTPFLIFARNKTSFKSLQTIFITGFSGMTASLILLFSFQNIFGYVYSAVGFIIALFMGGLTAGGALSSLYGDAGKNIKKGIILNQSLLAVMMFMTPLILHNFADNAGGGALKNQIFYFAVIFIFGFLTGIQFPLAGKILNFSGCRIEKSSGYVDFFDHLGAFTGALLTGMILLPILGITFTCFLAGFVNTLSAAFWFIRRNDN